MQKALFVSLCFMLAIKVGHSQPVTKISVFADKPGASIQPTMWGIFFEDINFAADGGLYAEMIKNRSFEFSNPLMGWKQTGAEGKDASLLVVNRSNADATNPRYASISLKNDQGSFTLSNEGFRGMGFEKGHEYNFTMQARSLQGGVKVSIRAVNDKGEIIGDASLEKVAGDWQTYKAHFTAAQTSSHGKFNIVFEGKGSLDADMISLFPADTWKQRTNGLRADLVQKLADLHPGFMRFPGGCIVEGRDLINRYQWKKTVGNVNDRQVMINRWNTEFSYKLTPDYFQSFGLGFFEYFQLCDDIGASPLPILNCGMACQYNTAEVASLNQIDPYIQDALDLIEFANGGPETKWGALRVSMGHPAIFNLKMIGVGNEQWGEQYLERYKLFAAAIKKAHPEIKMITSAGPDPDGERFDFLTKAMRAEKANFIDEHYYRAPEWFLKNANRYDEYDRKGTKIFAGEYATHIKDETQKDTHAESHNTIWSAITEAAFMTGLERNADVVQMASYAPLFAHVDAWQWRPDLIWFDNLRSVATPNYYVQQLFSTHKGNNVIPVKVSGDKTSENDSLYSSATIDKVKKLAIIKIVNTAVTPRKIEIAVSGAGTKGTQAEWIQVSGNDKLAFNSLDKPDVIKPQIKNLPWKGKSQVVTLNGLSANVFQVPVSIVN